MAKSCVLTFEACSEPKPKAASYHFRMVSYFGMSSKLSILIFEPLFVYLVGQDRNQALSQMASLLGSLFWTFLPHALSCWAKSMIRTILGNSELISSHHHQLVLVCFSLCIFQSHQSLHHSFCIRQTQS